MKICSICHLEKELSEFHVDRHLKRGLKASCKACSILMTHRYQATDRGHKNVLKHKKISKKRRRDRQRGVDTYLSIKILNDIRSRFNHQCFNCGASDKLEIDHHMPLSLGYGLTPQNAVLLCGICNNKKSNRLPEEFYTAEQISRLAQLMP